MPSDWLRIVSPYAGAMAIIIGLVAGQSWTTKRIQEFFVWVRMSRRSSKGLKAGAYLIYWFTGLILVPVVFNVLLGSSLPDDDPPMETELPDTQVREAVLERTFRLKNVEDTSLWNAVRELTGLEANPWSEATYEIEIKHNGRFIENGSTGLFNFHGGNLVIEINGEACATLEGVVLQSLRGGPGNPRGLLEDAVEDSLRGKILRNRELICAQIGSCISKE